MTWVLTPSSEAHIWDGMANQGNKFPVSAPPGLDFFALCCDFLMNLVGVVLHFEQAIKGWLQFLFNWQRNLWSAARLKYSNNNQSRNHQDQEWRHNLLLAITPEKGVTLFAGKQKIKWWASTSSDWRWEAATKLFTWYRPKESRSPISSSLQCGHDLFWYFVHFEKSYRPKPGNNPKSSWFYNLFRSLLLSSCHWVSEY